MNLRPKTVALTVSSRPPCVVEEEESLGEEEEVEERLGRRKEWRGEMGKEEVH